jgi:hypothetical protein
MKKNFYYYYNRVESSKQKKTVLTLKFGSEKWNVNKVVCHCPSETHNRKIRPYCVVRGLAIKVYIQKGVATIL